MIRPKTNLPAGGVLTTATSFSFLVLSLWPTLALAQGTGDAPSHVLAPRDTPVESVRTAYAAGRDKDAVVLADQVLASLGSADSPAGLVAEIHFWRGSALRRLERHDEARVALDAATRLGLGVPELHLERALTQRALGQEPEARQEYQEAERLLPPDDERRRLFAERWKREGKQEPAFQLSFTPQLGYDTNIVGLEKDAPLLGGEVDESSPYTGLVLATKYFLVRDERQMLALEYRNQMRAYMDESDFNYSDNVVSAIGRYPFLEWADFEVRGSFGEAFTADDGHLRTTRTIAPAIPFRFSSSWQMRLWGDWTDADYYVSDIPSVQDRDGVITRGGLIFGFDLGGGWSVAPHIARARYDADGGDYDHDEWIAGVALTTAQVLGCVLSPAVSYTRADYDHENSIVGFTRKRQDRIWRFSLTVLLRELEQVIGYAPSVTVSFLDHSSNLDPFDYRRWEPRIEMTIVALSF